MPVIGRLDEQVNELLITPLEQRRAPEPAGEEPRPAPPHEPPADETAGETPRAPSELPVWLL